MVQFVLVFFYYFAFATADSDCKSGLAFLRHLPSPPDQATAYSSHVIILGVKFTQNENYGKPKSFI
jgi:hypothetical protein